MGTRLFVGNVSYGTTEEALRSHFEERGLVVSDAVIVTDRETGRSRGFGFVELGEEGDARRATDALDGSELDGRRLTIREAFERAPRRPDRGRPQVAVERVGPSVGVRSGDSRARHDWPPQAVNSRVEMEVAELRGGREGRRRDGGRKGKRSREDWQDDDW